MSFARISCALGVTIACWTVTAGCRRGDADEEDAGDAAGPSEPGPGPVVDANPGPALPAHAAWVARPSGTTVTLRGVWASPTLGVLAAVGDQGTILVSRDRGASWAPSTSAVTVNLASVWGSADDDIYVVGDAATILHSKDGAITWQAKTSGAKASYASVWGSGPQNVFVGDEDGTIRRTRTRGDSFRTMWTWAITPIKGIWGLNEREIFAASSAGLNYSDNGGEQFSNTLVSVARQQGVWASAFTDIYTVNGLGIVTHYDGTPTLKKTELTPLRSLRGVWGTGAADVYVVGDRGRIAHTADRGETWVGQDAPGDADLHCIHGAAGAVFAVGAGGTILERTAAADAGADGSTDGGDGG
jgi:photosystem II stability/assembly factor-like uncharacterized protein